MAMVKHVSMLTAGCMLLIAGAFPASAQYRDRDYYDRDRDRGPGFSLRLGDDHDRGWRRRRDRDCHYVTSRYRDRDGDMVVRRRMVCDDDD
jgi:hypothetical protein